MPLWIDSRDRFADPSGAQILSPDWIAPAPGTPRAGATEDRMMERKEWGGVAALIALGLFIWWATATGFAIQPWGLG